MYEKLEGCRICEGDYTEVLDLGEIYPSTFMNNPPGHYLGEPIRKAPLTLVQCNHCGLVQLKHTVDLDSMYRQYWYKSGLNNSMVRDLKNIVENIEDRIDFRTGDVVIDIGANDGTMLDMFSNRVYKIGVEPALNMAENLIKICDYVVNDYFSEEVIPTNIQKAKAITAIAMFYDLPDPNKFVDDVRKLLHPRGIFVIQLTDLYSMLRVNAFDNICHEHLEYYSLNVLNKLMQDNGLRIFHVEYNKVNGNSVRLYIDHGVRTVEDSVDEALLNEYQYLQTHPLTEFAETVNEIKEYVRSYIKDAHLHDNVIYGMGASTKGNTLLQYFGINSDDIPCIVEINQDKYGLATVGSEIPIFPQDFVGETLPWPDIYFVLPWHFIDNFVEKNEQFLDRGGVLFVPLPWPAQIFKHNGEVIWETLW
jgi:hypothetical protein